MITLYIVSCGSYGTKLAQTIKKVPLYRAEAVKRGMSEGLFFSQGQDVVRVLFGEIGVAPHIRYVDCAWHCGSLNGMMFDVLLELQKEHSFLGEFVEILVIDLSCRRECREHLPQAQPDQHNNGRDYFNGGRALNERKPD